MAQRTWLALIAACVVLGGCSSNDNGPAKVVLKPVDAKGNTSAGWTVDTSRRESPIDCSYGSPSPYDMTDGVRYCGASADAGDACWPKPKEAAVLCLVEPFSKVLNLISANGLSTPRKPLEKDAVPMGLVLDDGTECRARNGGAWSSPEEHPDWVGYYSCDSPGGFNAVWGPRGSGITKGSDGWAVYVGPSDGHLTKHRVKKVYYVGVAHSFGR
ncbi:MAG TPA: hypothetical protein VH496_05470 [Mycobacterium sp.]